MSWKKYARENDVFAHLDSLDTCNLKYHHSALIRKKILHQQKLDSDELNNYFKM